MPARWTEFAELTHSDIPYVNLSENKEIIFSETAYERGRYENPPPSPAIKQIPFLANTEVPVSLLNKLSERGFVQWGSEGNTRDLVKVDLPVIPDEKLPSVRPVPEIVWDLTAKEPDRVSVSYPASPPSPTIKQIPSLVNMEVPVFPLNMLSEREFVQWGSEGNTREPVKIDLPVVPEETPPSVRPVPEIVLDLTVREPDRVFVLRPLDILFVIDTSISMYQNLIDFKEKFVGFLKYFSHFNWKLAVTDASHGGSQWSPFNWGSLKGSAMPLERNGMELDLLYLHPEIPDYNRIFLDTISKHKSGEYKKKGADGFENVDQCQLPPYCQMSQEQPLRALKSALKKNEDFFREEADLVVISISNARERASDPIKATQPREVIEQFNNIHGFEKRFEVYGIIITENDEHCLNTNITRQFFLFPEGAFSEKIAALSEMTGGRVFSICISDYQILAQKIIESFGKSPAE